MKQTALKQGDFTGLAENYAKFRPGYSKKVLAKIFDIIGKPVAQLEVADVGAGTGIWTRMMAEYGVKSLVAVEPNDDMRQQGQRGNANSSIRWIKGSAETTGLATASIDVVSMASSFHWADFDAAMTEFHRILKPGGYFIALWNPRYLDDSPMLLDIERKLTEINPHLKRKSSGKSTFVEELTGRLTEHRLFKTPVYLEDKHSVQLTPEQYLGVWNSVNDIRAQLGESGFEKFMQYTAERIAKTPLIECAYLTRAWITQKK